MTSQRNILQLFSHQQNLSTFNLCLCNLLRSADRNTKKKNNSFKRTDCSDWRDNVIIIDW